MLLMCLLLSGISNAWGEVKIASKTMGQVVSENNYTVSSGSNINTKCFSIDLDANINVSVSTREGATGNTGTFWGTTTIDWRMYQADAPAITISAKNNYTISKVKITYSKSNTGVINTVGCVTSVNNSDSQISSGTYYDVNNTSVTYYVGNSGSATSGQARITEIEVEYSDAESTLTKYNVNVAANITGGNVAADKESASQGETVTLTATPTTGYEFGSWSVINASTGNAIEVTENGSFTMPASNVNVSAVFAEIFPENTQSVTFGPSEEDDYTWPEKTDEQSNNLPSLDNIIAGDVKLVFSNGGTNFYSYFDGEIVRFYQSNTMTVTPLNGKAILKVVITRQNKSTSNAGDISATIDGEPQDIEGTHTTPNIWRGSTTRPIVFKAEAQARFTKVEVWYAEVTPEIEPSSAAVTLDFTSNDSWNIPTAKTVESGSFSDGTYSITLEGSEGNGYRFNSDVTYGNYLILGKNGASLTLPAFDFDVEKIVVYGNSAASQNVIQNIFVGENAISTATTGANVTNTYNISQEYQSAGNIFILKVLSDYNTQISKIEIYAKESEGPDTPTDPEIPDVTLTTIDEIFTKAEQVKGTATDVKVDLGNWVVSAVKNSNAFVTDGTKGFIIYSQNEAHGFEVGDILSGSVNVKIQLYRGSAELTNFTADSEGLRITKGGYAPVNEIADIATLTGVNTGSIISLSKLTCMSSENDVNNFVSYVFSDGKDEITLYGIFQELPVLSTGEKYNLKGMYLQFYETREVGPLSNDDIEEVVTVKYNVSFSEMSNGSIVSDKNQYAEGETVSLTVTPDANYYCSSLTVTGASGTVDVSDNKFSMPAEDVVVSATFAENPKVNITWNDRGTETVSENVYVGSALQFPAAPSVEDWKFMGWTASSSVASDGKGIVFLTNEDVVPEHDITYYAVFAELDKESAAGSYTLDYNVETDLAKSTEWGSYGKSYEYTASDGGVWVIKAVKNKGMQLNTGKDASIKVPDCPGKINSVEITGAPQARFYFSKTDYTGSKIDDIAHADGTQVTLDLSAQNVTTGYIWASNATSVTKVVVNYDAGESYTNYTLLPTTYYKIIVDDVEHGSISSDVPRASEGTEVHLYHEEDNHYHFVEWVVFDNDLNEIDVVDDKFIMPASDVLVSAEFAEDVKYTITWSIDGETENEYYYQGEEVSHLDPVTPEKFNSDWTFRGWVLDGTVVTENVEPEYVTPTTATEDVTYVAVFAIEHISTSTEKELKKLDGSTTFADGDEIVVFAKSGDNWYGMYQETVSTSYVNYFKVDHTPVIADVNDDAKKIWLVSAEENNKWKLGDEAHGYLLSTPSSNNLVVSKDSHSTLTIVWSQSNNGYTIKNGDRWIACRADLTGDNQYKYRGAGNQATPQAKSVAYFDVYRVESKYASAYSDFTTKLYLLLDEETNIPAHEHHSGTYNKVKVKRTIKSGNWSTLCLPFDMDDEQVTANFGADVEVKELTGLSVDGNSYNMHFTDSEFKFIYSGTPCMIRVSNDVSEIVVNDAVVNTAEEPTLVEVNTEDGKGVAYHGNYVKSKVPMGDNHYIISGNKFYFVNSDVTNKGFRGWFEILSDGDSAASLNASFDDETDGIISINSNVSGNDRYYNIAGQRVSNAHKGVFIKNGKKYVVK